MTTHAIYTTNLSCTFVCQMDIKKLSTLKYWTSFYKRWTTLKGSTSFDWLTDFNNVQDSLQPLLPSKSFNYLDMGCGISNFTAQLLRNSSYDIHAVCVDYTKDALITQRKLLQQIGRRQYCSSLKVKQILILKS